MESKFRVAFEKTMGHEGGYSNDPDDPGGETYRGISRVHHPDWDGWDYFPNPNFIVLDPLVQNIYYHEFWDKLECEWFTIEIGQELFDTAVNIGHHSASTFLQKGLNLLNNNQKRYADIYVDGQIGPVTKAAYTAMPTRYRPALVKIMNILQGMYYISLMDRDPRREKWVGWFGRVSL